MPRVDAWLCTRTNHLFRTEREYKSHMRSMARDSLQRKKAKQYIEQHVKMIQELPDIVDIVRELPRILVSYLTVAKGFKFEESPEELFTFNLELQFSDSVSNTHSCPRGGVTNWGGNKKDAPRGYPGWKGRIQYRTHKSFCKVSNDYRKGIRSTDLLKLFGIHTGAGSGNKAEDGAMVHGYQVELFGTDFPLPYEKVMKKRMMDTITS